ncbi:acyltransferase [Microbacterium sp. 22242]|uniref:acyltransferase n=1 Tax=Microbacterium sp. 22242 TaxID=3453896 RepID=UPI003F83A926
MSRAFDDHHFDYAPWDFWDHASEEDVAAQLELQRRLVEEEPGSALGERCFLSALAAVQTSTLTLGDRSYVAANAHLSGDVRLGADCSVNVGTAIRGTVRIGDSVRIGASSSILGFNHGFDPGVEIFRQPHTSRGITIGDDVWLGAHVVVLDGVRIGSGAVVGAGSIVTKDVPAGALVAGNPARIRRWREDPAEALRVRLRAFDAGIRTDAPAILDAAWRPDLGVYADKPGDAPTLRAQCDAIEISSAIAGAAPLHRARAEFAHRLSALQDPATGLFPELNADGRARPFAGAFAQDGADYRMLCTGYALDLLGSPLAHPVAHPLEIDGDALVRDLENLPWREQTWTAGAIVDALGTALRWDSVLSPVAAARPTATLFGWLLLHVSDETGMWGSVPADGDLLQLVNGYYRLTRGTFAQFGVPLPHPEQAVDTVLRHVQDARYFAPERQNACNVLDVVHPLWLLGRQSTHRAAEARDVLARLLSDALGHHRPGEGFGFAAPSPGRERSAAQTPGLQGTEMWLSIIWLAADALGLSSELSFRPRGVHRPEPAFGKTWR